MQLKALEISTAHITENDNRILSDRSYLAKDYEIDFPLSVSSHTYGYYIAVPDSIDSDRNKTIMETYGLSQAFVDLIDAVIKSRYSLLSLDRDGEVLPKMQKFDW